VNPGPNGPNGAKGDPINRRTLAWGKNNGQTKGNQPGLNWTGGGMDTQTGFFSKLGQRTGEEGQEGPVKTGEKTF